MKITRQQLKRIITESFDDQAIEQALMNAFQDGQGSASALELLDAYRNLVGPAEDVDTFSRVVQGLMDKGWISNWEGAQSGNPEDAMLYLTDTDPRDQYMESNMKITRQQLKRIIREEKQKLLREGPDQEETLWSALDQYVMVLDEEMGYDVPREDLKANVIEFVNDYFKDSAYAAQQAQEDEDYDPDSFIDPRRQ